MLYDPLRRFKLATKMQRYVSPAYSDPIKALRAGEKMSDQYFSAVLRLMGVRAGRAAIIFFIVLLLCWTTPHLVYSKFGIAAYIALLSTTNLTKWASIVVLAGLGLSAAVPPDLLAAAIKALSN